MIWTREVIEKPYSPPGSISERVFFRDIWLYWRDTKIFLHIFIPLPPPYSTMGPFGSQKVYLGPQNP